MSGGWWWARSLITLYATINKQASVCDRYCDHVVDDECGGKGHEEDGGGEGTMEIHT